METVSYTHLDVYKRQAQGTIIPASDVTVADPFSGSLETLQADYPEINVTKMCIRDRK